MRILIAFGLFLSITSSASEETFLSSLNGTWSLVSARNRSLFLEKEQCPNEILISSSLEEGVTVSSVDPNDVYGFEISAEEIKNKAPDPRSE